MPALCQVLSCHLVSTCKLTFQHVSLKGQGGEEPNMHKRANFYLPNKNIKVGCCSGEKFSESYLKSYPPVFIGDMGQMYKVENPLVPHLSNFSGISSSCLILGVGSAADSPGGLSRPRGGSDEVSYLPENLGQHTLVLGSILLYIQELFMREHRPHQ